MSTPAPERLAPQPRPSTNGHGPSGRLLRSGRLTRIFLATEELNRRAVLRTLPRGAGGAVLDVGTYDGDFTARIAERLGADSVAGIELMSEHADRARARGIDVVEADVEQGLPFPEGSFDVVTANQVIEHVRSTDRFLSEIRRVLRPDGLACISTNNLASWHNVWSLMLGFQPPPVHVSDEVIVGNPLSPGQGMPHEDHGQAHLRLFTGRALAELAAYHGLERVGSRGAGYYPLPPALARVAAAIDGRHAAFLISLFRRAAA